MADSDHTPDTEGQPERGSMAALFFISIVSVIVLSASVMIGSVYSVLFSRDLSVHWPFIAAMIGMTLYVIGLEIICHVYHKRIMYPLYLSSTLLMGAFFYMFLTTLAAGSILLIGIFTGWNSERTLIDILKILVIAGVAVPMVWGLIEGRFLKVKKAEIPIQRFSKRPLKIALISDVHLGLLVGKRRLGRIIRKMKKESPDIIVAAGDLLDTNPKFLSHMVPQLKELTSIAPSYVVIGNHEFYHGLRDSKEFLKQVGFELLDNRAVKDKRTDLWMLGVDDPTAFSNYQEYRDRIEGLLKAVNKDAPVIFVNHQPIHFKKAAELGTDLMLSGHTHAGQMIPGGIFTRMIFKDGDRGLNGHGDSYLYVCIGSGSWGPPIRVGAPSEMIFIDIVRK